MFDKQIRSALLTAAMSRKAGGLMFSVSSLAKKLKSAGCEVCVFAGADEFSEQDRPTWGDVSMQIFTQRGPAAFGYQEGLAQSLAKEDFDLVHVQGLWMYPSVAAKRWARNGKAYMITPRGMLDPWAVRNSAWKKQLAGLMYENSHLHGAACLHALCESERQSIRAYGLRNPVAVIPNGVDLPDPDVVLPAPEWDATLPHGAKVLFFLSRLHPKKGLVNLLHAWARVKEECHANAQPWQLVIAGWEQGGHQADLDALAKGLGAEATIHFVGPQFDQAKAASFRRADAFILPSFSEGLPMAVLEAWSYELPVIMTPHCNIPVGFEAGAAVEIQTESDSIQKALLDFFALTESERIVMGCRGFNLVKDRFTWQKIAEEMMGVYRWVLEGGSPPACVRLD